MSRAQRTVYAKLKSGRGWRGDLCLSLYKELGITSMHLKMVYRQLLGKLTAIREIDQARAIDIAEKVKSKRTDITRKERAIRKCREAQAVLKSEINKQARRVAEWHKRIQTSSSVPDRDRAITAHKICLDAYHASNRAYKSSRSRYSDLRFDLHQHKRKLESLLASHKLLSACGDSRGPCFGSRRLFNAQHNLDGNGYGDHAEWLRDWRTKRNSQFRLDGNSSREGGNDFARFSSNTDGSFSLELLLPAVLSRLGTRLGTKGSRGVTVIKFPPVKFPHGGEVLRSALTNRRPITVMFRHDGKSWKLHVSVEHDTPSVQFDVSQGVVGVDINVGFLAVTRTDRFGNPVDKFDVPLITHGKSQNQSVDAVRKAAAVVASYAAKHNLSVTIENLDFRAKKRELATQHPQYARMLSSFAYSAVTQALESACARAGVALKRVNPAYTSLIGRVKFARRYGLSIHRAAALCIARRAMKFSESVPTKLDGTISLPWSDGSIVTLRVPVRKRLRHVWSVWSGINSVIQKVFATHRLPGRKPRPPHSPGCVRGASVKSRRVIGRHLKGMFPKDGASTTIPGLWIVSYGIRHSAQMCFTREAYSRELRHH
jgi:IS605 OrfB family transposase